MIEGNKKRSFMSFNSKDFKGFTFRSGPVKSTTKQNSSFWFDNNDDIDVDEYIKAFDAAHEQYVESVKVENVYNRFVMFSSKTHHGVQTFGTKERLTLNFFSMAMSGKITPLQKSR